MTNEKWYETPKGFNKWYDKNVRQHQSVTKKWTGRPYYVTEKEKARAKKLLEDINNLFT